MILEALSSSQLSFSPESLYDFYYVGFDNNQCECVMSVHGILLG